MKNKTLFISDKKEGKKDRLRNKSKKICIRPLWGKLQNSKEGNQRRTK